MSKIGIEIKIDVTKINKARIFPGKKGKYLKLTTFVDPEDEDQYGNHGFVTQSKDKDEDVKLPILGNSRVFWKEGGASVPNTGLTQAGQQRVDHGYQGGYDDDNSIPF